MVISDSALGARLSIDFLPLVSGQTDRLAEQIVVLVRDTRSRFPQGVQRIIGVPSFVSRDLTHDYDYLQDQLAYVLQNGLVAWPGQAVLEVEEARAIQRELDIAGDKLAQRVVPCFIEGEFRTTPATPAATQPAGALSSRSVTSAPATSPSPTSMPLFAARQPAAIDLTLVVKDASGIPETVRQRSDTIEALAAWLQRDAPQRLLGSTAQGGAALAEKEQLALLAGRAETFARQGDYEHSTALREACLLIWPDAAEQHRALAAEYGRLLAPDWLRSGDPASLERWVRKGPERWRLALENLEYVLRHRLLTRDAFVDVLRESTWAMKDFVAWTRGNNAGALTQLDPQLPKTLAADVEEADALRRRFVLEAYPLVEQLPGESAHIGAEAFSGFRIDDGSTGGFIYRHLDDNGRSYWQPAFPRTKDDLDYVAQVFSRVARGRMEMCLDLPYEVLRGQTTPAGKAEFSPNEFRAFVGTLIASEYPGVRFHAQAAQLVYDFCRSGRHDASTVAALLKSIGTLAAEHGLEYNHMSLAYSLHEFVPEPSTEAPQKPAGSDDLGPHYERRDENRLQLASRPMELRTDQGTRVMLAGVGYSGESVFLRGFGRTLDLIWRGYQVYAHREPGKARLVAESDCGCFDDATWDGEHIWVGERGHGLIVASSDGSRVADITDKQGLPQSDQGLKVFPLAPGRVLAVGSFGKDCRAWCAIVEFAGGAATVDVFHEATRVLQPTDPPWLTACDPAIAFTPRRILEYRPANHPGQRLLMVERAASRNPNVYPDPALLAVDPEARQVFVYPPRHAGIAWMGQTTAFLKGGESLVISSGPFAYVASQGRRCPDGELYANLPKPLFPPRMAASWAGQCYLLGHGMRRYDPDVHQMTWLGQSPFRSAWGDNLAISALLGPVTWDSASRVYLITIKDPAANAPLPAGRYEVEVHNAATGEPVSDATVEFAGDELLATWSTDAEGRCAYVLTTDEFQCLSVYAWKDDYATREVILRSTDGATGQPPRCRITLDPLRQVGGVVQTADGRPLAGAQVFLFDGRDPMENVFRDGGAASARDYRPYDYLTCTDAQGWWQDAVLTDASHPLWLRVVHPSLRLSVFEYRKLGPEQRRALFAGSLAWKVATDAGLVVRVVEPRGAPVARAAVTLRSDFLLDNTQTVVELTDDEGRVQLRDAPSGAAYLLVQAPECAPELRAVDVQAGMDPVTVQLQPAAVLRGQVVDPDGKPVAGARIAVSRWRGRADLTWEAQTDTVGRFRWDAAPHDEVQLAIECPGFKRPPDVELTALPSEHRIQLERVERVTVRGTVTDADSGLALPRFWVSTQRPYYPEAPLSEKSYGGSTGMPFTDGAYRITVTDVTESPKIWFAANGYMPQVVTISPGIGEDWVLDVRLYASEGIQGLVRALDGTPAASATVYIALPHGGLIYPWERYASGRGFQTGVDGRFALRAQCEPFLLGVSHSTGWAKVTPEQLAASEEITLQPWGCVEGVCQVQLQGEPAPGVMLVVLEPRDRSVPHIAVRLSGACDTNGHFVLERVPPGEARISRLLRHHSEAPGDFDLWKNYPIKVEAGKTTRFDLRREGRPVKARVVGLANSERPLNAMSLAAYLRPVFPDQRPANYASMNRKGQLDWDNAFRKSPEGEALHKSQRYYLPEITSDYSFTFVDVIPGDYWFEIYATPIGIGTQRPVFYYEADISVPAPEDPQIPKPFDLGEFVLKEKPEQ
jgi:hypothetical protein